MNRLNLFLLGLVVFCAMQVVEFQHQARTLFVRLGEEEEAARQLAVALSHLQLSEETLAKGERVDEIARQQLRIVRPAGSSLIYMPFADGGEHE